MKHLGPKEAGASIVAVMVAMALFAIVAVMASQSFRNINASNRRADATMSARDAEGNIVQAIVTKYKAFVLARCSNAALVPFDLKTEVGGLADLMVEKIVFRDAAGNPTNPPLAAAADLKRCAETPFTRQALPRVDSFYSCYNITITSDAKTKAKGTHDAFAGNRGAFVEFYVRVRNLQTDVLLTCDQVTGPGQGLGLEVLYSIHWTTPGGSKTVANDKETLDVYYDNKTGSLSAAL